MSLKQTVEGMISDGYRDRFIAEYQQVSIRERNLSELVSAYKNNELEFEPDSPIELLDMQLDIMRAYKKILKRRAQHEHIILKEVNEDDLK